MSNFDDRGGPDSAVAAAAADFFVRGRLFLAVGFGGGLNDGAAGSFALEAFEIGAKVRSVLVAQVAVFLQGFVNDALEFFGNFGVEAHRRNGSPVQDAVENCGRGVALERESTGGHFIENRAEGEEIAARI
jgi:hypothetical protein